MAWKDSCTNWRAGSGLENSNIEFLDPDNMDSVKLFCKDKLDNKDFDQDKEKDGSEKPGDKDDDKSDNDDSGVEGQGDKNGNICRKWIILKFYYIL